MAIGSDVTHTIIDLAPLKLTPDQEVSFCLKRIKEQADYMKEVIKRPPSETREELLVSAAEICIGFAFRLAFTKLFMALVNKQIEFPCK